jgi:FlaA1/EpsC-like NDP-sugar epimerase
MRNRYVLVLDLPLIALAALGAFLLRFDWFFASRPEFLPFVLAALLVKPPVFMGFGLYGRYWKYASVSDLLVVVVGVTAASLLLGLLVVGAVSSRVVNEFSRSVLLIDWLLTVIAIGGLRFTIRLWNDPGLSRAAADAGPIRNAVIAGAGIAGAAVLREIQRNPGLRLNVVGFLDDDPVKRGKRIHGVRVLGGLGKVGDDITTHAIDEVIIAMPTAPGQTIRQVAQTCAAANVSSRTLPGMFELLDGRVAVSRLREVDISDLLRRAEILAPIDAAHYVAGRSVLVTGGGGSIGLELCRQVAHAGPRQLILLGHGENSLFEAENQLRSLSPDVPLEVVVADVRDRERIRHVFERYRPSIVFHAAAHKHVPMMERNP